MEPDTAAPDGVDNPGGTATPATVQEALVTVPHSLRHRTKNFVCQKSPRVAGFFTNEAVIMIPRRYCRVFILPNPDDETEVWGYYTLSAALLDKAAMTRPDEKKVPPWPAPMARIGFMGTDDRAERGLGRGLLIDAARRVARNNDIGVWGIVLESEGGPTNSKLWSWYLAQGFTPCRASSNPRGNSMYAPLSVLIPELSGF
jgi:hypothetical protein